MSKKPMFSFGNPKGLETRGKVKIKSLPDSLTTVSHRMPQNHLVNQSLDEDQNAVSLE